MNYVSNALKFTPRGGSIDISAELNEERDKLRLSVKDTGCGISQDDQAKLFTMFGMLESTKQINTKGIGLGLHICKLIVSEFGGEVSVESAIGEGSEFSFTFMLERQALQFQENIIRYQNPNLVEI